MEKQNEAADEELEKLFAKLKQLKVRGGSESCQNKVAKQTKLWRNTHDPRPQDAVHKTIKSTNKKIVAGGTKLKLARTLKSLDAEKCTSEDDQMICKKTHEDKSDYCQNLKRSCSMEFRNTGQLKNGYIQEDSDNTTPDELAGYMEQILHLPKPMSAMAEMMYG